MRVFRSLCRAFARACVRAFVAFFRTETAASADTADSLAAFGPAFDVLMECGSVLLSSSANLEAVLRGRSADACFDEQYAAIERHAHLLTESSRGMTCMHALLAHLAAAKIAYDTTVATISSARAAADVAGALPSLPSATVLSLHGSAHDH